MKHVTIEFMLVALHIGTVNLELKYIDGHFLVLLWLFLCFFNVSTFVLV